MTLKEPAHRINILCTDHGQHAVAILGAIFTEGDGIWFVCRRGTTGPRQLRGIWLDRRGIHNVVTMHMRCGRCQRHLQWKALDAQERLARLLQAGVKQLDIAQAESLRL